MENKKIWIYGAAGIVVVSILFWILSDSPDEPEPVPEVVMEAPPEEEMPMPIPEEMPEEMLTMGEGEDILRRQVGALVRNACVQNWLNSGDLLGKVVNLVHGVSEGRVPRRDFNCLVPNTSFSVSTSKPPYLDAGVYKRYNTLAGLVGSVDAREIVKVLDLIDPLLEAEYARLGLSGQGGSFRDRLNIAINQVLSARVNQGRVQLVRHAVAFKFSDPTLERKNDVAKLMYRMGPSNSRTIQQKLKEVGALL